MPDPVIPCAGIPIDWTRERNCCDTCGLFRTTVAQEMHKRAAEARAKRRQTDKPDVSTHKLPVADIIGEIATWLL